MSAYIEKGSHPFEPRHDGKACRQYVDVVEHRPIECGAEKSAEIHTGTRSAPPELEHRAPLCPLCGDEVGYDGDSFCCDSCGAYWSGHGPGTWNEPEIKACPSTRKPYDRSDLEAKYENIRHHQDHCILPVDHDGKHRSDEFSMWTDEQVAS